MLKAWKTYFPDWEPSPYDLTGEAAELQESGFQERAKWPISWVRLPRWDEFPTEGILGRDREFFLSIDAVCYASCEGEDLLLMQNAWFGWPDPPEWGLVSKVAQPSGTKWRPWGYFPRCPRRWKVPKGLP